MPQRPLADPSAATTRFVANSPRRLLDNQKTLVVLDAANIAMRHGKKKSFSCRGVPYSSAWISTVLFTAPFYPPAFLPWLQVKLALDYWLERGHPCVGFIPDYYLDYDAMGRKLSAVKAGIEERFWTMPQNIAASCVGWVGGLL